jgi:hypothetical protein
MRQNRSEEIKSIRPSPKFIRMNWIELEGLSKEDKIYLMKVLRRLIEEEEE